MKHIYSEGVEHRDLKADNVLLDEHHGELIAKVCDFGLSKCEALVTHTTSMSKGKGTGGTLAWKAPEEFDDAPFNEKCDVYSFAIVIWEIITRETPWKGLGASKIIMKVATGKRPTLDEETYTNLYGKGVFEVMKMCWQQDADDRPTFAGAMKLLTGNKKTSTTFFDEAIKQRQNDLERERLKEEQRKLEEDMKRFELDQARQKAEEERERLALEKEVERKRLTLEKKKKEEAERKRIEEERKALAEKKRLFEEAKRKTDEKRKRKEAKRKAERDRKRKEEEARKKGGLDRKRKEEEARRKAERDRKRKEEEERRREEEDKKPAAIDWAQIEKIVSKTNTHTMKQGPAFKGKLYLGDNNIDTAGCEILAPALKAMTGLKELWLGNNKISAAGCKYLAPALKAMTGLKKLNLSWNTGCEILAPALKAMTGLEELDLSGNEIDTTGCKILASALKAMTGLETLGLYNNKIDTAGCQYLAPALKAMTGLKKLDLSNNNIPEGSTGFLGMGQNLVGQALIKTVWKKAGKDRGGLSL